MRTDTLPFAKYRKGVNMEKKLYCRDSVTLDGKLDEAVWQEVKEYTGFSNLSKFGSKYEVEEQTFFKILPCQDRIYIGIKCMKNDMTGLTENVYRYGILSEKLELFLSPSGEPFDFYQFRFDTKCLLKETYYYVDHGIAQPDPYEPEWNHAVYIGEDYWSAEVELPFSAFYMNTYERWRDKWLFNIGREHIHTATGTHSYSTWSKLAKFGFCDPYHFNSLEGFPLRPIENDVCIISAIADMRSESAEGYDGVMKVQTRNAIAGTFEFSSDYADSVTVELEAGFNEFEAPCHFAETTRKKVFLALKRLDDGATFKRFYPVVVKYEPIAIKFTLPEYRDNFYPGQDYSKIVGHAVSAKPVTLKLEGPGIETTVITPNADGSFAFDTPNFEEGDAYLTATIDGYETKRKIRRLAPTGHMMTWVSGGNLILNGEPVLRRNFYGARYTDCYNGGVAFDRKYFGDNLHETRLFQKSIYEVKPCVVIKGSENPEGEARKDVMPCAEFLQHIDTVVEAGKDQEFAYYYISDEPECRNLSEIYLNNLYKYIADKDPYHVILTVCREPGRLVDVADWFEVHPFINPYTHDGKRAYDRPISTMGKYVEEIAKLNRPDKCIGFVPTCFPGSYSSKDPYPTLDEYICHTWAAMIRGGKSLFPYTYRAAVNPSLYEGTRYVFSSFEALEKIILFANRTTLLRTANTEAVLYELGEEKMFVLVNFTSETQTVTLDGISGKWHEFRHNREITGNTFELKPLEVVIGTSEVKDTDLPTYQETAVLIDKVEYDRTHGGSLLFERRADITLTTSGTLQQWRSLFNGIRDDLAWTQTGDGEKFIELGLTKLKPTFNKIVISGYNTASMKLKIRNGDELTEPAIAEKKIKEFSTTILLKDKICPESLRLEFFSRHVELYEIEIF